VSAVTRLLVNMGV